MLVGGSLFLVALDAVLKFAVNTHNTNTHGINIGTLGVILMVVGAIGLLISVALMATRRRTDVIHRGPGSAVSGTTYVAPHDAVDRPY